MNAQWIEYPYICMYIQTFVIKNNFLYVYVIKLIGIKRNKKEKEEKGWSETNGEV